MKKKKKSIEGYIVFMLGKRDYSENELRDRLEKKEYYDPVIVNNVIENFKEIGYISDARCVESLVNSSYGSLYGVNKIKQKAFKRSLDMDSVMLEVQQYDFYETCFKYLKTKIRGVDEIDDYKSKQKLINKLIARGFSFDEINYSIDKYKEEQL